MHQSNVVGVEAGKTGAPGRLKAVVGIPVRDERDRIADCLRALDRQTGIEPGSFGIVLFLNNCSDDTGAVVAATVVGVPLRVMEATSTDASAGWARRRVMEAAAAWLDEEGAADAILLTSDADSCVGSDWIALNLAAIAVGADAVAGRIVLDPGEARLLPTSLHARGRDEAEYEALLTEIGARLAPEPGNRWPCHWSKSGATLAVRASVYRAVGGMPDVPCGEDRAFVDAIRARGFRVRHAPEIVVVTSGRLDGRAQGGVADTIRSRIADPDALCDDRLESLPRFVLRTLAPSLVRPPRPMRPSGLSRQIRRARILRALLRFRDRRRQARPIGTPAFATDEPVPRIVATPP